MKLVEIQDPEVLAELESQSVSVPPIEEPSTGMLKQVTNTGLLSDLEGLAEIPETVDQELPSSEFGSIGGVYEAAKVIGSSILAEPLAGIVGLTETLLSDASAGASAVERTREALTYTPKTKEGEEAMKSVGAVLAPIGEVLIGASEKLGDAAFDATENPELAAMAYSVPTALLEILGLKGASRAKSFLPKNVANARQQLTALRDPVMKFDASVADVKVNSRGKLVTDADGVALLKNNFPETTTAVVTKSNPATKKVMGEMLDTFIKSKTNDVYAISDKVSDVIGKPLVNRFKILDNKKQGFSRQLDNLAENTLKGTEISLQTSIDSLANQLAKNFNIKLKVDRSGKLKIENPTKSDLANPAFKGTRQNINNLITLINKRSKQGVMDGFDAHKTKRLLDEFINDAKVSEAGITGNTMRMITDLRKNINQELRNNSPAYGIVNDKLSMIIESQAPFKKLIDKTSASPEELVGAAIKNLGSDTVAAKRMKASMLGLDDTAKALGVKLTDEPLALLAFKEGLDKFYRITDEALEEQIKRAGSRQAAAIKDAVASGSVGNIFGAVHDVKKLTDAGLSKKEAMKVVRQRAEATKKLKQILQ